MNPVLQFLLGSWFICSTNFPMWLKGDKNNPNFNYSMHTKPGKLKDEVKYIKKGKERSIKGTDSYSEEDSLFTWRGKGLLRLAKSEWRIIQYDKEQNWAVIYFSKTLFTPEGIDLISRSKELSKTQIENIKASLAKDQRYQLLVSRMKELYN